ncbi:hypothetical protein A8L45_19200 [Veronia pacifica]|uniref:Uncharacterized protein n=2 Tax=Veronia pacifica TaxID=1080227 RepID=A0A1C3EC51_9GAMM|nr:hypothetical protein A8L45_19200 [Veronia pacifica]
MTPKKPEIIDPGTVALTVTKSMDGTGYSVKPVFTEGSKEAFQEVAFPTVIVLPGQGVSTFTGEGESVNNITLVVNGVHSRQSVQNGITQGVRVDKIKGTNKVLVSGVFIMSQYGAPLRATAFSLQTTINQQVKMPLPISNQLRLSDEQFFILSTFLKH